MEETNREINHIDKIRAEIQEYFNADLIIPDSREESISPSKNYRLETAEYRQDKADVNWVVTKMEIFENKSNEKLFSFYCNERCFKSWQIKEKVEYLLCSEDMFGGQTIIDLTNRQMASYSPATDGFIWTEHHLSPDKKLLAVVGCFWAAPYVLKLYRFDSPLNLPLSEIQEMDLVDNNAEFIEWIDNKTVRMRSYAGEENIVKINSVEIE